MESVKLNISDFQKHIFWNYKKDSDFFTSEIKKYYKLKN